MKKLKRAVIKEELVALTGDTIAAVILNQFIYWSERIKDFDRFIEEEKERMAIGGEEVIIEKRNGWIYKKIEDLAEEIMITKSDKTIRRRIKDLVDAGWIDERNNPKVPWDRTKQYRVNIVKIQCDLQKMGYALEGYPLQMPTNNNGDNDEESAMDKMTNANSKNTDCNGQGDSCNGQNDKCNGQGDGTIPEITTDINNINNNISDAAVQKYKEKIEKTVGVKIDKKVVKNMLDLYGEECVSKYIEAYPLFKQNKFNPIGFLITSIKEGYEIPSNKNTTRNNKEVDFNKFEHHEYTKEQLERLFEDISP